MHCPDAITCYILLTFAYFTSPIWIHIIPAAIDLPWFVLLRIGSHRYHKTMNRPEYHCDSSEHAGNRIRYRQTSLASWLHTKWLNRTEKYAHDTWRLPHWKRP